MDGLRIGNFGAQVKGDLGLSRTETSQMPTRDLGTPAQPGNFADTLKTAIGSVNELQKDADTKIQRLATGQSTNLHETMIAVEKADIALRLMLQVRNKVIEAYQEVMRMQV